MTPPGRECNPTVRYDLASGRELGTLLASADAASDGSGGGGGEGFELTCMAAGGGLVAAAGEGADVFLWDSRMGGGGRGGGSRGGGLYKSNPVDHMK